MHEFAKVLQADLDRLGHHMAKWKRQSVQPLQFLLVIMSMLPKKEPGIVRMIASMASGWRLDVLLEAKGERAWCAAVADPDDAARPGSTCLYSRETRQMFLDILRALRFDTMECFCDFVQFYDTLMGSKNFRDTGLCLLSLYFR